MSAIWRHRFSRKITFANMFIVFPLAIISNWRTQLKILKAVSTPAMSPVYRTQPQIPFKYIYDEYLSKTLSTPERAAALCYNYEFLNSTLCDKFLLEIAIGRVTIYENVISDNKYSIVIGIEKIYFNEGELSIELLVNTHSVFIFSFTIVPGNILGSDKNSVIFLTRLQGAKGAFELIKCATKDMIDISPPHIIFAALSGFARGMKIHCIYGLNSESQICSTEDDNSKFKLSYDNLLTSMGGNKCNNGFFYFDISDNKTLPITNRHHRSRKKKQRSLKTTINECVYHKIYSNRRIPRDATAPACSNASDRFPPYV